MLILSKFLYGADSWVAMDNATQQNFHVTVMKLYKRLARVKADYDHLTDDEILTKVHLPSPSELLRRARLRYFVTLVKAEHEDAWTLLARDSAWRQLLEEDMVWMWKQLYHTSELKDPREHYPQWFLVVQTCPKHWKNLVKRACEHCMQQRQRILHVRNLHCRALQLLWRFLPEHLQPEAEKQQIPAVFGCMQCRLRCKSKAGEDAHLFKRHGQVSRLRMLCDHPTCPCCLKHFHTMQKLKGHVRHSARCRETLDGRNMDCPLVPGCGSTDDAERELTHDRLLPPIQCEGPQPPETRRRQRPDMDGEL